MHQVIQQLSHAGMGVLLATHDLDQAELLCGRVGFLRDGVIAPQGSPRALIAEAFGGEREIIIELRQLPTPAQTKTLQRAGFLGTSNNLSWSMMGQGSDRSATELSGALERVGLGIREIRLREPGLDSLFLLLSRGASLTLQDHAA
ncbi:hypothetical protein [uncultured Devosia sp.]|uniref:hypothetical protein n=1 Tax=uncultured Devosia sp. TaxID=211434 RepID=UPI0035CC9359